MGRKRENLFPKLFLAYDYSYPLKTCQDLSLKHRVSLFGCLWMVSGMLGLGAGGPRARALLLLALPWGGPARTALRVLVRAFCCLANGHKHEDSPKYSPNRC